MKKVWFIVVLLAVVIAGCEHQGNNPLEENPLDGYIILEQTDSLAYMNVTIDTVRGNTYMIWIFDGVIDTSGHEYALGSNLFVAEVMEDIPDELEVMYSEELLYDYVEGFSLTLYDGMEEQITDVYARSGSLKVLKHEGDYYELEYKFTMFDGKKYYCLYRGELGKKIEYGDI